MADFLVIGGMKCGTTALYDYLSAHHQVDMISVKELNFYNNGENWKRGHAWYESHFTNTGKLRGDINPNYAMHPLCQDVPAKIHSLYPETKLIYLVREPISRFVSHVQHNLAEGKEQREVEQIVLDCESGHDPFNYLGNSKYYMQLTQFTEYFPLERIKIIESSTLRSDREETLTRLLSFLELDAFQTVDAFAHTTHESARKRKHAGWLLKLFHSRRTGGAAGAAVRTIKAIMPNTIYEKLRTSVSRPVQRVALSRDQQRRLETLLAEDSRKFIALTGLKYW